MSQWKKIASFAALSASMALATTGCLAPNGEETTDEQEITAVTAEETTPVAEDTEGTENVGEADQAWWGGFGFRRFGFPFFGGFGGCGLGFGGCGLGFGGCGLGFGGCGFGGFGGCGFGGFGGCGFGGCGFPFWGGFGGCGC